MRSKKHLITFSHPDSLIRLRKPTWQIELVSAATLFVVLYFFRFPVFRKFFTGFLGGTYGDSGLYTWLVKSNVQDLFNLPWFTTNAFYPYGLTLAWSDNFILPSLVALPFLKAGIPLIPVYNSILLLATFLNGYLTFKFAYALSGKVLPALVSGAAFMTLPYFQLHLGHPQLQFAFWFPAGILAFMMFLERPVVIRAILAGFLVFLAFITTAYFSIFLCAIYFISTIALLLIYPSELKLKIGLKFLVGSAIGVLPILFFLLPYFETAKTFGERHIYETYYFATNIRGYFSSSPTNLLYGFTFAPELAEGSLFPGCSVLLLALISFAKLRAEKHVHRLLGLCAIFTILASIFSLKPLPGTVDNYLTAACLWLSLLSLALVLFRLGRSYRRVGATLGTDLWPPLIIIFLGIVFFTLSFGPLGNPAKGQIPLAPHILFYWLFPGFDSIRAIARIGLVAVFMFSVLASLSLSDLIERRVIGLGTVVALFLTILLENYSPKVAVGEPPALPALLQELRGKITSDEAMIALPLASELSDQGSPKSLLNFSTLNTTYMNWAADLGFKIVNGYSGQKSKLMKRLPGELVGFPNVSAIKQLSSIVGLRYVAYFSKSNTAFDKAAFESALKLVSESLKLIAHDEQDNYLFELTPNVPVDKNLTLFAPAYVAGNLNLEFRSAFEVKVANPISVEIFDQGDESAIKLGEFNFTSEGTWHAFKLPLFPAQKLVPPRKIVLRSIPEGAAVLGKTSYSSSASK